MYLSEKMPQLKKSLNPVERWNRTIAPLPPPGYNWGVKWTGTPDVRDCNVDTKEVIRSFKVWENFTVGTPSFWLKRIEESRKQVIGAGAPPVGLWDGDAQKSRFQQTTTCHPKADSTRTCTLRLLENGSLSM